MKQCVVRTYSRGYSCTTEHLTKKLAEGWSVAFVTPYLLNGTIEYVEYILQKEGVEE
jgi:hypothetical protein